jgi:cytochrome c-type biogenesis protein CcmE
MKPKFIAAGVVVVAFIIFGSYSFLESNVEYTNIDGARAKTGTFTFYLKDEAGRECKVILEGAAPNNFELATSVVAKGRFNQEGVFRASEVLTKCPSKYEARASDVKSAG